MKVSNGPRRLHVPVGRHPRIRLARVDQTLNGCNPCRNQTLQFWRGRIFHTTYMFPLRRFVDQLTPQMKTVGALIMNSIPFGRNASVRLEVLEPNTQQQPPPLVMDYTFRHQKDTPREIKHHRWKCIYHAPVAQVISVHNLDQGGEKRYMDASTQVRVNHYKSPQTVGVYQAAPNQLTQDSSLPDRYRELDFS
jgi:hypothetical protein